MKIPSKEMLTIPNKHFTAALLLLLLAGAAGASAESVRWTIADKAMSPVPGKPGCYSATLPPLPAGSAIDFTDGGAARTAQPYVPGSDTELTVDSRGCVVPWTGSSGVLAAPVAPGASELWFDLQGHPVENPSRGVFIRVLNGQATKIFLNN